MQYPARSSKLFAFAISEWLLVLPPALLLAAAALRFLQPREYEPARTSWLIFEWATTHISHAGAAVLFLGLPGIAIVTGCVALLMVWRGNETSGRDSGSGKSLPSSGHRNSGNGDVPWGRDSRRGPSPHRYRLKAAQEIRNAQTAFWRAMRQSAQGFCGACARSFHCPPRPSQ